MGREARRGWAEIAEAWERSGESQTAFAAKRGIALETLRSWIYRRRRQRQPVSGARMVEVRVAPTVALAATPAEICLPSGITVRISTGSEPTWAAALVKALLT